MSSAFEFEIGNRVAGHRSALQLILSLSENVLSRPPPAALLLHLLLCVLSGADGAVFARKILRNPGDREGENVLYSPLPSQPFGSALVFTREPCAQTLSITQIAQGMNGMISTVLHP